MQDITLFLFSSLQGIDRRSHLQCFLDSYYASFCSVFAGAGYTVPFTREELQQEYDRMFTYGITMALMSIPIVMESEDIPDLEDCQSDTTDQNDQIAPQRRQVVHSFKTNKAFRSRVLDIFNDILIDNKSPVYL